MSSIQWKDIKSNIHIKLSLDRIPLQSYQVTIILWYVEKVNWIVHTSFVSVLLSGFTNFVKMDEVISLFVVKVVTSIFNLENNLFLVESCFFFYKIK
jgi:hypothetical protein